MAEQQHYRNGEMSAIWRHQYDPLGNRIGTIWPDGHKVEHLTYGSGHVHGLLLDGASITDIERDDLHREVERTLKNGLVQTRNFDPMGRLKAQMLAKQPATTQTPLPEDGRLRTEDRGAALLLKREYAYDKTGQLTDISDSASGHRSYRYDPVGRLLEAVSPLGKETFAFDPAGNLLDAQQNERAREAGGLALETERHATGTLTDNLIRDYQGTRYRYDARGNLSEKIDREGTITRYQWNSLNQLTEVSAQDIVTTFAYDPLGRRIVKQSQPIVPRYRDAGSQYHQLEGERLSRAQNLGTTFYGWEGDRLAWESTHDKSVHYFYEPDSFIPLAQGIQSRPIKMHKTPDWTDRTYRVKEDPLWMQTLEPEPFQQLLFYHCDQIGTPQAITDEQGSIVWSAQYKAWGEAQITAKEGYRNPIRFQGQYFDHETGLHYNRHRYYDPEIGRFISKDPIGLQGGINLYSYAPNPVEWVDPWGLQSNPADNAAGINHEFNKHQKELKDRQQRESLSKNRTQFLGRCYARYLLDPFQGDADSAWYESKNQRQGSKSGLEEVVVPGTDSETRRNAEHYLYAYKVISSGERSETVMALSTKGYDAYKRIFSGSKFKYSPPTSDEAQSGSAGMIASDIALDKEFGLNSDQTPLCNVSKFPFML